MSFAMANVFLAVRLVERPTLARHFGCGVFVGLAAFFGRNLGLYGLLSFFPLILFLWYRVEREGLLKKLALWSGGVVVGYSPMLFMFLFVPGFFDAFLGHSVISVMERGSTNLPLPVPWPWS